MPPVDLDQLLLRARGIWDAAMVIWISGGWAMIPIAITAFIMFSLGMHIHLRLWERRFTSIRERTWRRWIDEPQRRRGALGRLIDRATEARSHSENVTIFEAIRTVELAPFRRDLKAMRICVAAAPLLGLFGTVSGMLATFAALASGSGGEKTMGMIAEGISVALITTETGLVVALTGLFFQYQLTRRFERYEAFLAHLESVCGRRFLLSPERPVALAA